MCFEMEEECILRLTFGLEREVTNQSVLPKDLNMCPSTEAITLVCHGTTI
jgi:hypothetical protein